MIISPAEQAPADFANAKDYGPYAAAMSMLMVTSGFMPRLPDRETVFAFARQDHDLPDIQTGIGAARSFRDDRWEVRFQGALSPDVSMSDVRIAEWLESFEHDPLADFSDAMSPTPQELVDLASESTHKWSILLHVSGDNWSSSGVAVQPTLLKELDGNTLIVNNPGNEAIKPASGERLSLRRALGKAVIGPASLNRVSLLAVRRSIPADTGTTIGR